MKEETRRDMKNSSIAKYLMQRGYNQVFTSPNPNVLVIAKIENTSAHVVYIINAETDERTLSRAVLNLDRFNQQIMEQKDLDGAKTDMLAIMIGAHSSVALNLCKTRNNCWYLDQLDQKIYLYDNQISDFQGLRYGLERFIEENGVVFPTEITKEHIDVYSIPAIVISVACIVMTLLFYLGVVNPVDCMLNADNLFVNGEWYRLFTYQFSHLEISHLMMNLLMLNVISTYAEHYYGKLQMIISYLICGAVAGIFTMSYSVYAGNPYNSLGASGAIYGLIGMVLFQIMINWRSFSGNFFRRLIMAIVLLVIGSVYSPGVDHIAHIGGFLCGYILGPVFVGIQLLIRKNKKKD